jgi:hypothetical protein
LGELLQELRVAQAGVQILFAFLLSVTFSARFGQMSSLQRTTLVVTILLTTASAVLLMATAVWHRLYFRKGKRVGIVRWGSRCALGGALLLAAAMAGTVFVTTAAIIGSVVAAVLAACTVLLFATVWLVVPRAMHGCARRDEPEIDDRPQQSGQCQADQE